MTPQSPARAARLANRWLPPLLLAALVGVCYANALLAGFVWDDLAQVRDNPYIRSLGSLPEIFTSDLWITSGSAEFSGYYRPLQNLSYVFDYLLWGGQPFGYHLTNVLLHLLVCLLLYTVTRQQNFGSPAAFAIAALFAVHPLHVEEATFIGGRGGLLSAVFLFGGLALAQRGLRRNDSATRLLFPVFLAVFLAFLAKPLALLFPAVMAASVWIVRPDEKPAAKIRHSLALLLTGGLAAGVALAIPYWLLPLRAGDALPGSSIPGAVEHLPAIMAAYAAKIFVPVQLAIDYGPPTSTPPILALVIYWLALILLPLAFGLIGLVRGRRWAFWLCFAPLLLGPLAGLWRGYYVIADRYAYLPIASLGVLLAWPLEAAGKNARRRFAGLLLAMIPVLAHGLLTIERNNVFLNADTFWTAASRAAPTRPKVVEGMANHLARQGRLAEAITYLETATAKLPGNTTLQLELAMYLLDAGRAEESERLTLAVLQAKPANARALKHLSHLLFIRQDYHGSFRLTERILAANPRDLDALVNKAILLILADRPEKARAVLGEVLAVSPLHGSANLYHGMMLFEEGRRREAAAFLRRGLAANPGHAKAREMLRSAEASGN